MTELGGFRRTSTGNTRVIVIVVLAGLAAGLWMALLTRNGVVLGPDSTAYVGAAQNVADGKGITLPFVPDVVEVDPERATRYDGAVPLGHYSPMLPAVLGIGVWSGIPATAGARGLNVLACAVTTAALAWAVLRSTRDSLIAAAIAVLLFLTTGVVTLSLSAVATEALFVPLSVVALGLLARWLVAPHWWWGVAFTLVAAAAPLARTVGVAVVATGVIAIALWLAAPLRRRLELAAVVGVAGLLPALAWRQYDASGVGELAYHPPSVLRLRNLVSSWLSGRPIVTWPTWTQSIALILVIAAVVTVIVVGRACDREAAAPASRALVRVAAVFTCIYTVMLYLTITFIVITVPFGTRYMLPVLAPAVFLAVVGGWTLVRLHPVRRVRTVSALVLALVLVPVAFWHLDSARESWRESGSRPARPRSGLFAAIRALPKGSVVFTNEPHVVYDRTKRFAITLPPRLSIWSGHRNPNYRSDRAEIGSVLCRHPGVVAITGRGGYAGFPARDLKAVTNLGPGQPFANGLIMPADPATCP